MGPGRRPRDTDAAAAALRDLRELTANQTCFDCSAPSPSWASVTYGIFLCLECTGHHRSFGTHISAVKSLTLDEWNEKHLRCLRLGGNERARQYLTDTRDMRARYYSANAEVYRSILAAEVDSKRQERSAGHTQPNREIKVNLESRASKPLPLSWLDANITEMEGMLSTSAGGSSAPRSVTTSRQSHDTPTALRGGASSVHSPFKLAHVRIQPLDTHKGQGQGSPAPRGDIPQLKFIAPTPVDQKNVNQDLVPGSRSVPRQKGKPSLPAPSVSSSTSSNLSAYSQSELGPAAARFSQDTKHISSDQYFYRDESSDDEFERRERVMRLRQMKGVKAISSAQYFGREEPAPSSFPSDIARRVTHHAAQEIEAIKGLVSAGLNKLSRTLS